MSGKRFWGVEVEIARMTATVQGEPDHFPLLTTGLGFHIPGAIKGEGLAMLTSLHKRGHTINLYIMDRAYSSAIYAEFHVPARLLGAKLVVDYKAAELGVQASDTRGFVQVSGSWYLNALPNVLREADTTILAARNQHGESAGKLAKAEAKHTNQHKGGLARRTRPQPFRCQSGQLMP